MTPTDKARHLAKYWGCKIKGRTSKDFEWLYTKLNGATLDLIANTPEFEVQLIAKHLSDITEAGAIAVAEAATKETEWYFRKKQDCVVLTRTDVYDATYALSIYFDFTIDYDIETEFYTIGKPIKPAGFEKLRALGYCEEWMFESGLAVEEREVVR